MLLWLLLGALFLGAFVYTVSYVITRLNIIDTIKAALATISTKQAEWALKKGCEAIIKEAGNNTVKLDVLIQNEKNKAERMDITINSAGVEEDIKKGMELSIAV